MVHYDVCVAGESGHDNQREDDIMTRNAQNAPRFTATQHEAYSHDVVTFGIQANDGSLGVQVSGPHMTDDGICRWLCAETRKLNSDRPGRLSIVRR